MSTLHKIEQIIKVRLILAKFNALLYKYDSNTKNHIVKHIKDWIKLYKNENKENNSNLKFYNYLSEMDFNNHVYFINLCDYIDVKECDDFIHFLHKIIKYDNFI